VNLTSRYILVSFELRTRQLFLRLSIRVLLCFDASLRGNVNSIRPWPLKAIFVCFQYFHWSRQEWRCTCLTVWL